MHKRLMFRCPSTVQYTNLLLHMEKMERLSLVWQSLKVSNNGKDYTFHLKHHIKFNDGSNFDAKAVKFSIERAKATDKTNPMETLDKLKSVTIKDNYTVDIHLKMPSNQVLNELSQIRPLRIMSPHAVKDGKTTENLKSDWYRTIQSSRIQQMRL